MKKIICLIMMTVLFSGVLVNQAVASEKEAIAAAQAWLALVDEGNFQQSYEEASSLFRRGVTVEQWQKAVENAREMLGERIQRSFSRAEHHTTLPGAPDGNYVVIFFTTSFTNKKKGVETITPMLDKDGTWRVSGYYVR